MWLTDISSATLGEHHVQKTHAHALKIDDIKKKNYDYFDSYPSLLGDNYKWWWQNPNFGDPNGCLVGKYKPFGKKISFQAWKKPLEPFRARFENKMGNIFFDYIFWNIGWNAPQKNLEL